MTRRDAQLLVVGMSLLGLSLAGLIGVSERVVSGEPPKALPLVPTDNVVKQGFPARKMDPKDLTKSDTAWEIVWDETHPDNGPGKPNSAPSSVLTIASAKFMYKDKTGQVHWITILKHLELGEIFVPYDDGQTAYYDISEHTFYLLGAKKEFLGPSCVSEGEILGSPDARKAGKVMKEVHDDGIRWMDEKDNARRGEKMLLWSVFYGANYRYLIEYGFTDDGIITCRIGATARNFYDPSLPRNWSKPQQDVHLHIGCWRWDVELGDEAVGPGAVKKGGAKENIVQIVRRMPAQKPPDGTFRVEIAPFKGDAKDRSHEGSELFRAEEFTVLRVESTSLLNHNKDPQPVGYDLIPLRFGSIRDFTTRRAKSDEFADSDFWVTKTEPSQTTFVEVPTYARKGRILDKEPITVWHSSGVFHVPRSEDLNQEGNHARGGVALTAWAGFVLRPHNLFDGTPFYSK